jgi:GT2 family glycosyltransferase
VTGEVVAAWVHPTEVDASFMHSMLTLVGAELLGQRRLERWMPVRCGSNGLIAARNEVAAAFLAMEDAEWLWWVDTDMGFAPDALDQLLAVADPDKAPIVGGLCFAQMERDTDGMGGFRTEIVPALYQWHEISDGRAGFVAWRNYPRDAVAEVAGTGSAFVLIHRSVFERIAAEFGDGHWYERMLNPLTGQLLGEDLAFCARARMLGIPIFVNTAVRTTHRKPRWVGEDDYLHPDGQGDGHVG